MWVISSNDCRLENKWICEYINKYRLSLNKDMILWPICAAGSNQSHNWTQQKAPSCDGGQFVYHFVVRCPLIVGLTGFCNKHQLSVYIPQCVGGIFSVFLVPNWGWHEGRKDGDTTWPWYRLITITSVPAEQQKIIILAITWHISSCWPAGTLIAQLNSTIQRMVSSI